MSDKAETELLLRGRLRAVLDRYDSFDNMEQYQRDGLIDNLVAAVSGEGKNR